MLTRLPDPVVVYSIVLGMCAFAIALGVIVGTAIARAVVTNA